MIYKVLLKITKNYKKNKTISKSQQKFKSERHNVFTEEIIEIALSSNDDERIRSTESVETYAFGAKKRFNT